MAWESFDGASGAVLETIVREVEDEISLLVPNRYPLLDILAAGAEETGSTQIQWIDEAVRNRTFTITSAATQTTSDSTLTASASQANQVRVGDILRPRGSAELMLVTAVASTTVTATRGYSGTTATAIPAGTVIEILGNAALEGAAYSASVEPGQTQRTNYTQIFREDFDITGTAGAVRLVDPGTSNFDLAERKSIAQLTHQMAMSIYQSGQAATTGQGSASVRRSMDGIMEICRTGNAASSGAVFVDGTATDYDDFTTNIDNLLSHVRQVIDAGGTPTHVFVSPLQAQRLTRDGAAGMNVDQQAGVVNRQLKSIASVFGDLQIMWDHACPRDASFVVDVNKLKLKYLRRPATVEIGAAGDGRRYIVRSEMSLVVKDGYTGGHGVFYDLA